MILAGLILAQSSYAIGCPMKEGEEWRFDSVEILKTQRQYIKHDLKCKQTVLGIDNYGVQHVEVEVIGGTINESTDGEKSEPEDPKGETWNFYLNGNGQQFQYEEIKATFEDDPLGYVDELLHVAIDRKAVAPGETWRRRTKIMDILFKGLPIKKIDKYDCIGLERTGTFLDPLRGTFKVTQWYRCDNGRLQSESTTADDLVSDGLPMIDYTFTYSAKEK
ncbi:MAG: hypothetical protein WCK51_07735 [Armatimonadota bacterium]